MKFTIWVLGISLFTTPVFAALEGGASTGGGGAFVCYNPDGSVRDAELLDLWEGRNIRKWNIPYTNELVETQVAKALAKLDSIDQGFLSQVNDDLQFVRNNLRYLPPKIGLAPPSDAESTFEKPGCPLRGMMLFHGESNKLMIKNEIFSKLLDNTNVAAAWVHEAVYKTLRKADYNKNSINARKLTSCLFSTENCLPGEKVADALPTDRDVYECQAAGYPVKFFLFLARTETQGRWGITNFWEAYITQLGPASYTSVFKLSLTSTFTHGSYTGGGWGSDGGPLADIGYFSGNMTLEPGASGDQRPNELPAGLTVRSAYLGNANRYVIPPDVKAPVSCVKK